MNNNHHWQRMNQRRETVEQRLQREAAQQKWLNERNEFTEKILSEAKKMKYEQYEGEVEQTECIICLMEFQAEDDIKQMNACVHIFHDKCFVDW